MSSHEISSGPDGHLHGSLRFEGFARFLKRYIRVSSVIAAALPIPFSGLQLIPTYQDQTKFLTSYASLFCFLILAFVFYSRHKLARLMFGSADSDRPRPSALSAFLPLALIIGSFTLVSVYHAVLNDSVTQIQNARLQDFQHVPMRKILSETEEIDIPHATWLIALYVSIFLTAESAFILMALREYLQDLLGLSEKDLIFGAGTEIRGSAEVRGSDT